MLNICRLIFIRKQKEFFLYWPYFNGNYSYDDSNIFAMCLLIFSWLVTCIPFQVLNIFIILKYTWYFMRSVFQCIIYSTIWYKAFCQESLWCNKYNGREHLKFKILYGFTRDFWMLEKLLWFSGKKNIKELGFFYCIIFRSLKLNSKRQW